MKPDQDLIPTFKLGESVMVHYHACEFECPKCSWLLYSEPEPYIIQATIVRQAPLDGYLLCHKCGYPIPNPEGMYNVNLRDSASGLLLAVPYTLLERIEE